MDVMGLKKKILDEILEDLDSHEGEKLRPKAAVSITAVKPEEDGILKDEPEIGGDNHPMMGGSMGGDEDDDDLKALLSEYLSQK